MPEFKEVLKELRKNKNISQKQVASILEISERAYQHYEYGTRFPDFQGLQKLADFFNVSVDYLMGRSNDPTRH